MHTEVAVSRDLEGMAEVAVARDLQGITTSQCPVTPTHLSYVHIFINQVTAHYYPPPLDSANVPFSEYGVVGGR